jgi:hypothetical protein
MNWTEEIGALLGLDEIISDSHAWMRKHDNMFPGYELTEDEKETILHIGVKMFREEMVDNYK